MGKKIKRFFSNDRKVSKLIFNLLIIGVVVLIAGNGVFAYFKREAADNQFGYGYGYGYNGTTYGYGYGYGYGANISGNEDYGFWGIDGKATPVSVAQSGNTALVVSYTTGYLAKNKVYYGTTNTGTCNTLGSVTSQTAFQTGSNSLTLSSLSCNTTYYYCVASEDAGSNVWYVSISSQSTAACAVSGGGGGVVNPPSISGITVTVADTYATIQWQTSGASLTWLMYGTSTAYGSEIKTTTSTASHSITLTGLSPSTAYHYQIKSKDSAGNVGTYTDKTFTTLALGEQPKVVEGPISKPISEMTKEELNAEISRIAALISQLRTQLAKISPAPAGIPDGFTFAKNLSAGMSNSDVVYLKKVLDVEVPDHAKWTGTKYFGSKVKAAVIKFQQKYSADISTSAGYTIKSSGFVGKGTRVKLNQLLGK